MIGEQDMHSLFASPIWPQPKTTPPPRRDNLHATAQATGMAGKPPRVGDPACLSVRVLLRLG